MLFLPQNWNNHQFFLKQNSIVMENSNLIEWQKFYLATKWYRIANLNRKREKIPTHTHRTRWKRWKSKILAAFLATVRIEPMNRSKEINKTFTRTAQTNLLQNFHWHKHMNTNRFGCVVVFATLSCSYSSSLSLSGHSPCLLN